MRNKILRMCSYVSLIATFLIAIGFPANAEIITLKINWWEWQERNVLKLCPRSGPDCYLVRDAPSQYCKGISGDFEIIVKGIEEEKNNSLVVLYYDCDPSKNAGVLCIDTGEDGGFETCGRAYFRKENQRTRPSAGGQQRPSQ